MIPFLTVVPRAKGYKSSEEVIARTCQANGHGHDHLLRGGWPLVTTTSVIETIEYLYMGLGQTEPT
jgi:hypothetical protein